MAQTKPDRGILRTVNQAANNLAKGHYIAARTRLRAAVTAALASGQDWQAALSAAIATETTKGI
jgi:hypothetical protein